MSDPQPFEQPFETTPMNDALTTEQLAKAGDPSAAVEEPRTFDQEAPPAGGKASSDTATEQPIFAVAEADELKRSWDAIQANFVDEPRRAVEEADHLVAATMKRLAEMFAEERARLEGQWSQGDDVSTEDLRVALQRYRGFFGRLLSV